ncbi:WW domain-containing transcription regulator protein 1 [Grus japonensis]|uniref:WW domain-containing transcription regulator protein 1 n=1 Tax=Grus japonensis TaxID=30415 RepID=A0ABC9X8R7_GRUJA
MFSKAGHIEKITTWQDPRKTMNQPLNHMSHHPAATSTPIPQRSMAMSQPNLVMNHQHQITPSTAMSQQSRPAQTPQPGLLTLPSALTTQQQQQQKLRLQRIQMERERIRMRQEELLRQEAALCRQLPMDSESPMAPVQTAVNAPAMTQDMRPITNNGSDPFLNSGPYHSREQSTDSGLGLGCYSIPTTPEDFLSNVDEMDTGETIAQTTMNINPQQTRFPDFLDCLPGTNVDLGTLESEDLIPILNDVEQKLVADVAWPRRYFKLHVDTVVNPEKQGVFQTTQISVGLSGADTRKNGRNAAAAAALSLTNLSVLAEVEFAFVFTG